MPQENGPLRAITDLSRDGVALAEGRLGAIRPEREEHGCVALLENLRRTKMPV